MTAADDAYDERYFFEVRLLLEHPSMHPDVMSDALDLTPHDSFVAGEPLATADEAQVGGVNAVSYWFRKERYVRNRRFFHRSLELIAHLELRATFIHDVISTGGTVTVEVRMARNITIGDIIEADDLARFVRLGVRLGIDVSPDPPPYRFSLGLRLTHPSTAHGAITQAMGVQPTGGWTVGVPRTTPTGTPLEGINKHTYWYVSEKTTGSPAFMDACLEFVEFYVEPHAEFIRELVAGGGSATLTISLSGEVNIGDGLSSEDLMRLAQLGLRLTVEVFPVMNG